MFTARIENKDGVNLTLTGDEPTFQVLKILGLNPPQAQLNTTTIVGMDGALFNSSKLNTRNIVLTIKINGNVEQNRLALYRLFRTKERCRFFYKNGTLDTFIDGYVQSVECDYFTNAETAQISIICPSPYFKSVNEAENDMSAVQALFQFPFSIDGDDPVPMSEYVAGRETTIHNDSESECGAEFTLSVLAAGITDITITNKTTGEWISLDGTKWQGGSFAEGSTIVVGTSQGQKRITIIEAGVEKNGFSVLRSGSTFLQLRAGENVMAYTVTGGAGDADVTITVKHYDIYRGV